MDHGLTYAGARRGLGDRIAAAVASCRLAWQIRGARRSERIALRALGDSLAGSAAVGKLVDEVRRHGHGRQHLETAIRASIEEDRADFGSVSARARLAVVVRGLAARTVLRDRRRAADRARDEACERLGKSALDGLTGFTKEPAVIFTAGKAREARGRLSALVTERAALLAPFGGSAIPGPLAFVGRETGALAKTFFRVLAGQLIPRVPALAGMGAGWWVASTFTDSQLVATLHSWGIGHGPSWAVRSETLDALRLWLPIAAAAVCTYLGHRLGSRFRARYSPSALPAVAPERSAPPTSR